LLGESGGARCGEMRTPHGVVPTPAFMPVGTQGAVKGVTHRDLEQLDAHIILGNTYHLFLRPGDGLIARAGGLHRFIGWTRPILTDSGGYQIFSLAERRRMREEGAEFQSHLDGSRHLLSPERAADIQAQLGSDVAMVLDECIGTPAPDDVARAAMERSVRWAARARDRWQRLMSDPQSIPDVIVTNPGQAQFGIVQGGVSRELRTESVQATTAIGFEAYAIGGLSVGEPPDVTWDIVGHTLLDGERHARRPFRVRRARHRFVRLRAPDAERPQRAADHAPRADVDQERPVRRGLAAAGPGVWLLHMQPVFAGVSAPPLCSGRDDRRDPEHPAQPLLLP
jgi:queuine tRNA-ribosyltransferase